MKKHSDEHSDYDVGDLLGLGSHSVRKNYYPELQARIDELEREKNRYKWLFENALHGIFQGDLRGGFLVLNPAMAKICGYAGPEDLKKRVRRLREQLFYTIGEFDGLREELMDFDRVVAREVRLRRADGQPVDVAVTLLRRPDLGAEVVEAFVLDITERVEARKRLEQLNAELEHRVDERTRALKSANEDLRYQIAERKKVEQELVVAVEAAKEANRSKDKYLAAASHDLLQPLNAARLLVSSLQDSDLPDRESHLVDRVHRALEGAEDLLADLLDISKLDQQAMKPDLVPVDVGELVQGLGEEFEPVARDAGLAFRVRHRAVTARTDPRMMTRILRNLLSNALRYTPQGRVLLAMRRRRDRLDLEVWDTGVGIAPDKLEDVFTEFHQLPQAGKGRKGVGLGLAIVDRMARVLGCQIQVTSTPGKGSRFRLSLPIDSTAQQLATPAAPAREAVLAHTLEETVVLVIDNEPDILVSMQALLERWGCRVLLATDTDEALTQCRDEKVVPDAILADFHLDNDLTGCEAIYAVRHHCQTGIPAAIITADRSDACRRLLQAQSLPVLNKPVKPNRLRALLTSLVSSPVAAE
ncbi:MAG: NahK/ErcS family hybrid sensor histidine kinase/response regulator [Marinobacter sp.]|uniref:hybrid sensor histidine kinase/response regulator n=1 Tax=Marinobacter sp. TaxID=50741 RepID=UPI00299F3AAE|nr:NahK/ErcS family hybrid sensor histidine kinase/response regulator [Marinobacter sp.]MDX1756802.1 NahK/ErcS family hybrid sensor histidine kinase/response regulator [Marinobacter sp.]